MNQRTKFSNRSKGYTAVNPNSKENIATIANITPYTEFVDSNARAFSAC